jgi:vacuolar-type H+-ATPase subunit I/STV1
MEQITLRIPEDTLEALDDEAAEDGVSRSEHIRDILDSRNEHAEEVTELRARADELETELDRVRNEKRLLLREREEKAELVNYVKQERTAEQRWREAGVGTRLKWRLFGMPTNTEPP